ncbi:MAG: 4-hydroxythreonine-4-phosphate dehydrogenase PdxA [Planctomycetes bacterium]|nr:4-hydroxythreonine-4-phosphate dehydrogenase PdxA [Planctomycetota bacterium]
MVGDARPWIGLTLGDPAGIGPEICLAALADAELAGELRLVCCGPERFRPRDVPLLAAPTRETLASVERHAWLATPCADGIAVGKVERAGGEASLAALRAGVDLATRRVVDSLVTAPVSKEALHLAGERVEGQTELLARWAGVERYEMLAIAGNLRVMLLTRHMPLVEALARVTRERVLDHLVLLDETLRGLGFARPKLALAGLNPHAGEHGILGREEIERLEPAVADARERGLDVAGPLSPDTVFLQAWKGAFDGVLALYHDQAFIPVKLAAPETGLTLIAGLPYTRISPAHGTAFDIAGKGVASPRNLKVALRQAAAWARTSVTASGR